MRPQKSFSLRNSGITSCSKVLVSSPSQPGFTLMKAARANISLLTLTSASRHDPGWQRGTQCLYPGVFRVSAQNCSHVWSKLLIPIKGGNYGVGPTWECRRGSTMGSLTSRQPRLVNTGGRLIKHARYDCRCQWDEAETLTGVSGVLISGLVRTTDWPCSCEDWGLKARLRVGPALRGSNIPGLAEITKPRNSKNRNYLRSLTN